MRGRTRWAAVAATASLFSLGVLPLTMVDAGELPGAAVRSELAGQPVLLSLPGEGIEPKGLVLWFHGQGGGVDVRMADPFLDTLRRDGWAVASSDYHRASWGNRASTRDVRLLTGWARDRTGLEPTLYVAGSMGAAVSLNAMLHGVRPPRCWYAVRPAIALTRMDAVPGATRFIRRAFDGPVPASRDPVANLAALPAEIRYRVVASRDDPWVAYDENAEPFVRSLGARGVEVSEVTVYGGHDDDSHFNGRDVLAFANSCLAQQRPEGAAAEPGRLRSSGRTTSAPATRRG